MTKKPQTLILSGDGINCERETALAFTNAGAHAEIVHVNDLLSNPDLLKKFQALAFPGGFSFGDDLGSGQILAVKIKSYLEIAIRDFVNAGNPVIGICNGFQALAKLGLLPYPFQKRQLALAPNSTGTFMNRWVNLEVEESSVCIWTKGLQKISLPIRHGEGKVVFYPNEEILHHELTQAGQIPLRYTEDVNGSYGRIAGICDPKGLIFGLMPHPEAAVSKLQYPNSSLLEDRDGKGEGFYFFENCVRFLKGK